MRNNPIILVLLCAASVGCGSSPTDTSGLTGPASTPSATSTTPTQPAVPSQVTAGAPAAAVPATGVGLPATAPATATTPAIGTTPTVATPGTATTGTTPATGTPTANVPPAGMLPPATGGPISMACRGFAFENILYSPGGDITPNICEAFHPTLNNQHAVRCVDVWPWYKTNYSGDQYCILPPPPDKGVQLGHHPQGEGLAWHEQASKGDMSGYMNPPADWTLPPGGEGERNIQIKHQSKGGKYYRTYSRMRGGSHHMIVSTVAQSAQTNKWGPGGADGLFNGNGVPGAQRPDENAPQSFKQPAEDVGLYREVVADPIVNYNMHHFNSTDKPILKEAWQNLWWEDNPKTKVNNINGLPILQAVGTFAQPGQIVDMHYASTVATPTRVLGLFGHRHAWTTNFSAWVERTGKPPEILYQSFDWFDEPTYTYNSEVKNAVPDFAKRSDGAASGIVNLAVGDKLHFNCHIEYTDARAKEENSPVTPSQNGPLRFANEAYNAEMCILFGAAIGDNGTMEQLGPPPDFAKSR